MAKIIVKLETPADLNTRAPSQQIKRESSQTQYSIQLICVFLYFSLWKVLTFFTKVRAQKHPLDFLLSPCGERTKSTVNAAAAFKARHVFSSQFLLFLSSSFFFVFLKKLKSYSSNPYIHTYTETKDT